MPLTIKEQEQWGKYKERCIDCPYCGSSRVKLRLRRSATTRQYWIDCAQCDWCGGLAKTIKHAVQRWNETNKCSILENAENIGAQND